MFESGEGSVIWRCSKGSNQVADTPVGDTWAQDLDRQRFSRLLSEIHRIARTYGRQYLLEPSELRIALQALVRALRERFDRRRLKGSTEGGAGNGDHQVAALVDDRFERKAHQEINLDNPESGLHAEFSAKNAVASWPPIVSAWTRLPGDE